MRVAQNARSDLVPGCRGVSGKHPSYRSRFAALRLSYIAAVVLLSAVSPVEAVAQKPPKGLLRNLAASGSRFEQAREHYTYTRRFRFHEMDRQGRPAGSYDEVREVLFSPSGERIEQFVGRPHDRLKRIRLTEEDFRDLREVQPFVLTEDTLWRYELRFKGLEDVEDESCYVFRLTPKQVLEGQRVLDGMIWVSREHEQIVKVAGKPLPQIHRSDHQNLFPQFATIYEEVEEGLWFPVKTIASDILPFRSGGQAVKYSIDYENYKRFQAESTVTFTDQLPQDTP